MFLYRITFLEYHGFEKISGKFCGRGTQCNLQEEPRYGSYLTFDEAAVACKNDTSCRMVMDRHCDDEGGYELCSSSNLCVSAENSCSYMKPGNALDRNGTQKQGIHIISHGKENNIVDYCCRLLVLLDIVYIIL